MAYHPLIWVPSRRGSNMCSDYFPIVRYVTICGYERVFDWVVGSIGRPAGAAAT